jgi:hypothetical protein
MINDRGKYHNKQSGKAKKDCSTVNQSLPTPALNKLQTPSSGIIAIIDKGETIGKFP